METFILLYLIVGATLAYCCLLPESLNQMPVNFQQLSTLSKIKTGIIVAVLWFPLLFVKTNE